MATAYSMATAHSKATAKGHEANSSSYLVLEIKRNLCLFCVWFVTQLISRNHLAQGPFVYHSNTHDCVTKEPLQAAYRIIHKTIHQGQSILQSSIVAYWILSGIDPGTKSTTSATTKVPVPFWDRYPGSAPHPPPPGPREKKTSYSRSPSVRAPVTFGYLSVGPFCPAKRCVGSEDGQGLAKSGLEGLLKVCSILWMDACWLASPHYPSQLVYRVH